jgi:hypothetical protein
MYRVGGGTASEVHFLDDDTIPLCRGTILNSVDGIGITFGISERDSGFRPIVNPRSFQNAYASEEALPGAVWRTLVGNRIESKNSGSIPPDNWK